MIGSYRDWERSQALPNMAREQGLKLLSHRSDHMNQAIIGYMDGHDEEFIWSQRLGVWFAKGTSPDAAKEALRQRKMKDARADEFCYPLDDIAALRIYQTDDPHPAKQTGG